MDQIEEKQEEKVVKSIKRRKYLSDKMVVDNLKDCLQSCYESEWDSFIFVLYDSNSKETYSSSLFTKDKDFLECLDIAKHRHFSQGQEVEEDQDE